MVFKWKYTMPVSADVAGKELGRIEAERGCVNPQLVLDESREESSPLHKCFEWNDGIAAEKYRLNQAGLIIRNLVVVLDECEHQEPVRAYVNIQKEAPAQTGEFINIVSAMQHTETREVVMANALRELQEFKKKYKSLNELFGVFAEIDKLQEVV